MGFEKDIVHIINNAYQANVKIWKKSDMNEEMEN